MSTSANPLFLSLLYKAKLKESMTAAEAQDILEEAKKLFFKDETIQVLSSLIETLMEFIPDE